MLYLFDASIYLFRAWHEIDDSRRNTRGEPFNAVAGFADTLLALLAESDLDELIVAWDDCHRQGLRNRLLASYKSERPPAHPRLVPQFDLCRRLVEALAIPAYGSREVEADDIIGHFAALAKQAGQPVTVVSGDKDLIQYVGPADRYWDYRRHPPASYGLLGKRLRLAPEQVADWLALSGDKSDGIPGVPGIGPGTAARLLRRWQNLDNLFANLESVADMRFRGAPSVARNLFEHKATVALARQLTGPLPDPALPDTLDGIARAMVEPEPLRIALVQLGFDAAEARDLARRRQACNRLQLPA